MAYSDEERKVILKKMENPSLHVICPRCGKNLKFIRFDSAVVVECESKGCIKGTARGI